MAAQAKPPMPNDDGDMPELDATEELALLLQRMPTAPPPVVPEPVNPNLPEPAPPPGKESVLSQAHGAAPQLSYREGRIVEVICSRCFQQAMPRRRLAGANILTLVIAGFFPIVTGIILMLLSSPTLELDRDFQAFVAVNQLTIGPVAWAICLILSLGPAVAYHVWRILAGRWVCLSCGEANIWEAHSPVAKMLLARHTARTPAYPFE